MSHNQSSRRLNERQLREIAQVHRHVFRLAPDRNQALRVADISRSLGMCRHRVTRWVRGLFTDRAITRLQLSGTFRYYAQPGTDEPRLANKPSPVKKPDPRLCGFTRIAPGNWKLGNYEARRIYPGRLLMVDYSKKYTFPIGIASLRECAQLITAAEQGES